MIEGYDKGCSVYFLWRSVPGGGGVLPYVTLTGTCGPIGYGCRVFCLERGIYFITFSLKQGIAT